ncbi:hypothetical protein EDC01DRAFT_655388 [Geopyxis carbonaria]|nr:hypothetical protein EDC01DRAFT_655388 [Geopyxis carbonaria]
MSNWPTNNPQRASSVTTPTARATIITTDSRPSIKHSQSGNPFQRASERPLPDLPSDRRNDETDDEEDDLMDGARDTRPGLISRPSEGRSAEPLLEDGLWEGDRGRGNTSYEGVREVEERARLRHEMRSRSPASAAAKLANRRKYILAGFFLVVSLISFVVQTETAVYIQHELGWKKSYLMLYFTHGSWSVLWPVQLLVLKARKPNVPWRPFMKSHFHFLKSTAQMVMTQNARLSHHHARVNPVPFMIRKILLITCVLTFAGSTWYIAVNMTTPSDLTAIYNCSAFFAYVFSIFMLGEKPRKDKIFSVLVAIIGVLIVAYGDQGDVEKGHETEAANRLFGNILIGIGSVLYGFYEVLYKKMACPPEGVSAGRSVIFANAVASGLGIVTLTVLWIPIPILHMTGIETFELPQGAAAKWMLISVFANATFSGAFLVLISLTSPVLSSVASLLTIFLVAITDWMITGKPLSAAAIVGGLVISGAFVLLTWSTWREMNEDPPKEVDDLTSESDESED